MKQFIFILIFILCLTIPTTAYSTPSKTIEDVITITPSIPFSMAEEMPEWDLAASQLKEIEEEFNEYVMLDAIYVSVEEEYIDVTIALSRELTTEDEPIVFFVEPDGICIEEIGFDENGAARITLYEGNYFLCFYVRGE